MNKSPEIKPESHGLNFGLAFGKKKPEEILPKNNERIDLQQYDKECANAVLRVHSNHASEKKKLQRAMELIEKDRIVIDLSFEEGFLEDADADASEKGGHEQAKLKKTIELINETKDERRLLNHRRYLEMWDKHEGKIKDYF